LKTQLHLPVSVIDRWQRVSDQTAMGIRLHNLVGRRCHDPVFLCKTRNSAIAVESGHPCGPVGFGRQDTATMN